jgi:electron transfer flavoprotein alpha/beta subunit
MRERLIVFVQVWCEIDPTLNPRVDRTTGDVRADEGDRLLHVSRAGRIAVAVARRLLDAQVIAFGVGAGHDDALRHARAAGADRAIELRALGDKPLDAGPGALAEWLKTASPDLLIADRWAGTIAGHLGWAHLAGITDVEIASNRLRAVRHLERGDREHVSATLPAAVRLACGLLRAPYVPRARIDRIASKEIEREVIAPFTAADLVSVGPIQVARARTHRGAHVAPSSGRGLDRLGAMMGSTGESAPRRSRTSDGAATPEEMADEFVRYLKHYQLLQDHGDADPFSKALLSH